jgi:DNA-binding transcriptional ArsR family regulator
MSDLKKMEKSNLKIDTLLNHISLGKKPIVLVKQLNISKQLLSYHLSVLKRKGIIRKLGNGVWELVKELPKDGSQGKEIRAHAFIWKIKLPSAIKDWDKREEILKSMQIPLVHAGNTIRIEIKGKKVWLCNKSIIIYEPKSFFDSIPLETRKLAVYELIETIKALESKIGINLGKYKFSVKREHFAIVKNELANQCNKEGEKIRIRDNGELWFEIDNSFNLDEAEFYKTNSFSGLVNSTGAQGYFNSQKNTSWKVTPEFILNAFAVSQSQLAQFSNQIKSHLSLIQEYRKENISWRKNQVKEIKKEVKEGSQTTLGEF